MARPRVAAGALFLDDRRRALLVQPTYKETWDIPGGYVEPGESPLAACIREVREELGITPPIGRLLVVDWAPSEQDGDKLLFIFDGGHLAALPTEIARDELAGVSYVAVEDFPRVMNERLAQRVAVAERAAGQSETLYLEHGLTYEGALK